MDFSSNEVVNKGIINAKLNIFKDSFAPGISVLLMPELSTLYSSTVTVK